MSISGALNNALTGLTAATRAAEVVSSNLSNIMTDGYGRREISQSPRVTGSTGGVQVNGVNRLVDPALLSDRRFASSDYSNTDTTAAFLGRVETLLGTPEDEYSLSSRIASFETSIVAAASRPESTERLDEVVLRAGNVAETIKGISDGLQDMRREVDTEIADTVDRLNISLEQVRDLNVRISSAQHQGKETASLEDLRQSVIDTIAEIIPVREVPRDRGAVALFTPGGAILVDSSAAELSFTASNVIMPHMTIENGLLSGLEINGRAVRTDSERSPIAGGKLGALFEIRDEIATDMQAQIDAVARDLVERFEDPTLDATRALGDPGLFTDQGAAFVTTDEIGLAGRLQINAAVDPSAGGGSWRIRDGLGAATPGSVGDASLLQDLSATMSALRTPSSGGFGSAARSSSGLASSLLSSVGFDRQIKETQMTFASTQFNELKTMELQNGVDSDYEMQRLMLIEQAYAANARMIETVDELMQNLLRL